MKEDYLLVVKEKQIDQMYAGQYLQEMYQEGNQLQPFEGKYKFKQLIYLILINH